MRSEHRWYSYVLLYLHNERYIRYDSIDDTGERREAFKQPTQTLHTHVELDDRSTVHTNLKVTNHDDDDAYACHAVTDVLPRTSVTSVSTLVVAWALFRSHSTLRTLHLVPSSFAVGHVRGQSCTHVHVHAVKQHVHCAHDVLRQYACYRLSPRYVPVRLRPWQLRAYITGHLCRDGGGIKSVLQGLKLEEWDGNRAPSHCAQQPVLECGRTVDGNYAGSGVRYLDLVLARAKSYM